MLAGAAIACHASALVSVGPHKMRPASCTGLIKTCLVCLFFKWNVLEVSWQPPTLDGCRYPGGGPAPSLLLLLLRVPEPRSGPSIRFGDNHAK